MTSQHKAIIVAAFFVLVPALGILLAKLGHQTTYDHPAWESEPVKVNVIEARAYTLEEIMAQSRLDAGSDNRRAVLFHSVNAPQMILYDTAATHPACSFNGKPMQVMEVEPNGFSCYRWSRGDVYMRIEWDKFAIYPGNMFKPK